MVVRTYNSNMHKKLLLLALALVAAACGSGSVVDGPGEPRPSDPPPNGPAVAQLALPNARLVLHQEGDGCLVVSTTVDGYEELHRRECRWDENNYVRSIDTCFISAPAVSSNGNESDATLPVGCVAELPEVIFGILPAQVAHLCLTTHSEDSNDPVEARFVSPGPDTPFIDLRGGASAEWPYTASGLRWGDEVIDTDVDLVELRCQMAAPWEAPSARAVSVSVQVEGPDGDDDTFVLVDLGLGATGVTLANLDDGSVDLPLRAASDTRVARVGLGEEDSIVWADLPLPDGFDLDAGGEPRLAVVVPNSLDPKEVVLSSG